MNKEESLRFYLDLAQREGIKLFENLPKQDWALVRWWVDLVNTGEIDAIVQKTSQTLYTFLGVFQPPARLLYSANEKGEIEFVHWAKAVSGRPEENTASNGLWGAKHLRGSKKHMIFNYITYKIIFCFCDVILGETWQPEHLDRHRKIGYDVVGYMPNFLGREQYYFVRLTEKDFDASESIQKVAKLIERIK